MNVAVTLTIVNTSVRILMDLIHVHAKQAMSRPVMEYTVQVHRVSSSLSLGQLFLLQTSTNAMLGMEGVKMSV